MSCFKRREAEICEGTRRFTSSCSAGGALRGAQAEHIEFDEESFGIYVWEKEIRGVGDALIPPVYANVGELFQKECFK